MSDRTEGAALGGVADRFDDVVDSDVDRVRESEDLKHALGESPNYPLEGGKRGKGTNFGAVGERRLVGGLELGAAVVFDLPELVAESADDCPHIGLWDEYNVRNKKG